MAQLPPRIPAAVHHCPEGGHHGAAAWADDFAEFAASRRGAHRRSLSDSVAFVEVAPADGAAGEFDRLDDDQLLPYSQMTSRHCRRHSSRPLPRPRPW